MSCGVNKGTHVFACYWTQSANSRGLLEATCSNYVRSGFRCHHNQRNNARLFRRTVARVILKGSKNGPSRLCMTGCAKMAMESHTSLIIIICLRSSIKMLISDGFSRTANASLDSSWMLAAKSCTKWVENGCVCWGAIGRGIRKMPRIADQTLPNGRPGRGVRPVGVPAHPK